MSVVTFTAGEIQNTLPDPSNPISYAGSSKTTNTGSAAGPGYASVQLTSEQPTLRDRTNSGRILARAIAAHKWKIAIKYNPMTQTEFDPIYSFLLNRRGGMNPFFVSLPQYSAPKDATFAASSFTSQTAAGTASAGAIVISTTTNSYNSTTNGTPRPGDLFTINSPTNSNHLKAYMVTRVESYDDYQANLSQPSTSQLRVYFTPGLSKSVAIGDSLVFTNPKIKVILSNDVQQYSLNANNLYEYSLNLEEVQ